MPKNGVNIKQVPPCPGGTIYEIQSGDTLFLLARRFNTTLEALLVVNPGIDPQNLQIGQQICIPVPPPVTCPEGFIYTIRAGDTFFLLAQRYGISVQDLLTANPGVDPDRLQIGQNICIPVAPAPPAEPALPCCAYLPPVLSAPPLSAGVVLVRMAGVGRYAFTYAATNLPEPETLGDFDAYIGSVIMPREEPPRPVTFSAVLGRTAALNQPVTWSGTRIVPERPRIDDTVVVRPINLEQDIPGPILLRNTLFGCCRG